MSSKEETIKIEKELMFAYSKEQSNKMFEYVDKVLERNEHINLTAVRDRNEAAQKHIVDSLLVTDTKEYQEAETVIDVGTGAGFPGALLAIASPEKKFTLLDSTLKRLRIIDEFAEELSINNIETLHARAEEINKKEDFANRYDLCVSRAVANLSTLIDWCLPFVKKGGYFISYKGENYQEELSAAERVIKKYGAEIVRIDKVSDTYPDISGHTLIVIRK